MVRPLLTLAVIAVCACAPVPGAAGGEPHVIECSTTVPCAAGKTCLATGLCATTCSSDAACPGGKCSAAGGCVATTGCGGSLDCAVGTVCGNSVCVAPCTATSCLAGERCTTSGRCLPGPGADANTGAGAKDAGGIDVFPEGNSCGGERYAATAVEANFLIVLDHSGSMKELVGGKPKWTTAVEALRSVTTTHQSTVRFGLQIFSMANPACFVGKVDVPVDTMQAAAISAALPSIADGKSTPIGGALHAAAANQGIRDSARSNNVLLVTDGEENCNGTPVDEVKRLFGSGVKTYVVGFGGQVNASMLSQMATQGGTARPSAVKYYQADDPNGLTAAFGAITNGALACDVRLVVAPPDPSLISVYVNGVLQSRDPGRKNGWEYSPDGRRVTLYGGTCSVLTQNPQANVTIVYGCPDGTLVPGGPGGRCTAPSQCGSGRCVANFCVAPALADGSACVTNGDCRSGFCIDGFCGTPAGGGKPVGATCANDAECDSTICLSGFCTSPIN